MNHTKIKKCPVPKLSLYLHGIYCSLYHRGPKMRKSTSSTHSHRLSRRMVWATQRQWNEICFQLTDTILDGVEDYRQSPENVSLLADGLHAAAGNVQVRLHPIGDICGSVTPGNIGGVKPVYPYARTRCAHSLIALELSLSPEGRSSAV